jgi:pilus assembly protein CpaF
VSENSFAPTPLGKDWQPPAERVALGRDHVEKPAETIETTEETADLGALFLDSSPEETDLGSLFLEPLDEPATDNATGPLSAPPVEHDSTLGDLFGDVAGPGTAVTDAGDEADNPPAARRRPRKRPLPASLRNATDSQQGEQDPRTDAASVHAPAVAVPQRVDDAPVERRFPVPPVPPAEVRVEPTTASRGYTAIFTRGGREVEQLWQIVDQTLGVISGDTGLQRLAGALRLVPDAATHRAQQAEFQSALRPRMAQAGITLGSVLSVEPVLDLIVDEVTGISVIGEYYRDPDVNEILVDRWDTVSVERLGRLERTPIRFRDPQHAESTARGLALKISDRAVSRSIPLVTAELPSARVTFAFGAVVKGGLSVTIRKFRELLSLEDLLAYGTLNEAMVEFLRDAVAARSSILVSGGTGTGKTTIINLLSTFIPDSERVITIEDAFELKLANNHVVSLQTKEASSLDDTVSVTLADLLRNTLRMRPDRIIVGEIREGEGAMVMLTAANTGHDGTITTIHANSAEAAMNERLPDLVRQERSGMDDGVVLRSVSGAFDIVLQVLKSRNGRRYISEISNVAGADPRNSRIVLEPIFIGTETVEGTYFERRPVRADTELGRRLMQGGKTTWTS